MNGDNWPAIASHIMGHTNVDQMHDALMSIVNAQYAETHQRLSDDNEYQHLKEQAEQEALSTPSSHFARNRLALHVEMHMPPIGRSRMNEVSP